MQHNHILTQVMQRAKDHNTVFNLNKLLCQWGEISLYHGYSSWHKARCTNCWDGSTDWQSRYIFNDCSARKFSGSSYSLHVHYCCPAQMSTEIWFLVRTQGRGKTTALSEVKEEIYPVPTLYKLMLVSLGWESACFKGKAHSKESLTSWV